MTGMPEHAHRHAQHRQPRNRRVDHTTPGFVRPPDPEPVGDVEEAPNDAA